MTSTTIERLPADTALALPLMVVGSLVLAAVTQNLLVVGAGILATVALQITLHRLAVRTARRLGSQVLPWCLWGTATMSVWIALAGLVSIAAHMSNVQGGFDDSFLIAPALVVGAMGVAAVVASIGLAAWIGVALLRRRGVTRDHVSL